MSQVAVLRLENPWEWIWISLYGQETIVSVHRFVAIWYKAAGNEPLSIVMVQDPGGKYPDTVFFDTDTVASDEDTIKRFSHRWSIEITNRETKSLLGSADPQCRSKQSVTRAPLMAYWSYCFVVVWFVNQFRMGKDLLVRSAPGYINKNITFSDMLAAARRGHFSPGISRDPSEHCNCLKIDTDRFTQHIYSLKKAKLSTLSRAFIESICFIVLYKRFARLSGQRWVILSWTERADRLGSLNVVYEKLRKTIDGRAD